MTKIEGNLKITTSGYLNITIPCVLETKKEIEGSESSSTIPSWAKQPTKPSYTASEVGALPDTTKYAGSQSAGGAANKAVSIPFGQVDSTSTDTAFTATVDGITELRDGVCVFLKNGVVTSTTNCTLNINDLGAKPMYFTNLALSRVTSQFNAAHTALFIYNTTRVDGGCWDYFVGYDTDMNDSAYKIRIDGSGVLAYNNIQSVMLVLSNGKYGIAVNETAVTTTTKVLTTESFDPFGNFFYHSGAMVSAGSSVAPGVLWLAFNFDLRRAFNITAGEFVTGEPIYLVAVPQSDGLAKLHSSPLTQILPSAEDGLIYIFLGIATSGSALAMHYHHPIYYYKNGAIRLWTNQIPSSRRGVVSQTQTWTGSDATGYDYTMSNLIYGEIPQANIDLFEDAGAVFNATTGYFELNGLTDISYQEMMQIYNHKLGEPTNYCLSGAVPMRTNIRFFDTMGQTAHSGIGLLYQNGVIESFNMYVSNLNRHSDLNDISNMFYKATRIKKAVGINITRVTSAQSTPFVNAFSLETLELYGTKISLGFANSPRLSLASVVYLVDNAANTSAITITLHATAFARCQADTTEYTYNENTYTGIIAYAAAKSITIQSA